MADSDTLLGGDPKDLDKLEERRYLGDYYEEVCKAKYIRPLCIQEGVDFDKMSTAQKFKWYFQTFVQMISLIVFSVRTDRLWQPRYLRRHWKHYSGILFLAGASWTPQLADTVGSFILGCSPIPRVCLTTAVPVCIFALLYYFVGISLFLHTAAPVMREKFGKESTLKFWEYFVTVAWQIQTLGFWFLTIAEPVFMEDFQVVPVWLSTGLGMIMVAAGIGFKISAIYGTGYNTYYWFDMCTDIPNAYFSEIGIYKYCSSPTYTLGRFTSFGVALLYRSFPILLASILDLVTINLFNRWVEQPSVKKMYLDKSVQ